ncbi:slowpoke-binding protein isoform X2 [Agrilus planipennis]|uniref:Slowpoke-binding protein isoform X2 n=1 Tax=Agrilus planipennis TaxID=224129 RepID=A0A7F5R322_AGRPL|nr:slowpoke-binding protein isoform X2 [Agrilus planipennis]
MFNIYQNIKPKEEKDEEMVIGHDRFCQRRPSRSSYRRKRRMSRRAQSATEFSKASLSAAQKRVAFRARSQSSDDKNDSSTQSTSMSVESIIKLFSSKSGSSVPRHEYSALRTDSGSERHKLEKQIRNGVFSICKEFLSMSDRYEFRTQLGDIGSRADKHWFIVQDTELGAERLLSLVGLPSTCPITPSPETRRTFLSLFRGLQHPYIHPILDLEFWDSQVALISPLNLTGSLKDLIYGTYWHDDWELKSNKKGIGLPLWQVQRLSRQILEALMFLRDRSFPPFYCLHSGNVILQNGVARLAGLENPFLGVTPRSPNVPDIPAFGHLLFEMAAGYELPSPPSPAHLQLELERVPKVVEVIRLIFQNSVHITLEDILACDLFRGVELRELRGVNGFQGRFSPDVVQLLDAVKKPSTTIRRRHYSEPDDLDPWYS